MDEDEAEDKREPKSGHRSLQGRRMLKDIILVRNRARENSQ